MGMHTVVSAYRYACEKLRRRGDIVFKSKANMHFSSSTFHIISPSPKLFNKHACRIVYGSPLSAFTPVREESICKVTNKQP